MNELTCFIMDPDEEMYSDDYPQEEGENNNNDGFQPLEEKKPDENNKRKRDESPLARQYKDEINKLLSQYPELQLRNSSQIMARLAGMGDDELRNVRDNCVNDLIELRGSPAAAFSIFAMTAPINYTLPGYTERCLRDKDLAKSVDLEIITLLGNVGNRAFLFFRLINNAYLTWRANNGEPEIDYATRPSKRSRPNESREESGTEEEAHF
jgi:hypothetical protein